ncbi:MAG: type IX secretion system membrane protein PorP/SprF [Bacteroidetes bacterium]|nr:type IX secretion system membrane protein PorP/SprF [Bacteroidota bacterium]
MDRYKNFTAQEKLLWLEQANAFLNKILTQKQKKNWKKSEKEKRLNMRPFGLKTPLVLTFLLNGWVYADSLPTRQSFSSGSIENRFFLTMNENPALAGYENGHHAEIKFNRFFLTGENVYYGGSDFGITRCLNPGILFEHSTGDFLTSTTLKLVNSFDIISKPNHILSLGFGTGYLYQSVDWNNLTTGDMIDKRYGFIYDTKETKGIDSRGAIDFTAGLWYTGNNFYGGLSAFHLTQPYYSFITSTVYRMPRIYFLSCGYAIKLKENIKLIPSFIIEKSLRTYFSPALLTTIADRFFAGISLKYLSMVSVEAGMLVFKNLRLYLTCGVPVDPWIRYYQPAGFAEVSMRWFVKPGNK